MQPIQSDVQRAAHEHALIKEISCPRLICLKAAMIYDGVGLAEREPIESVSVAKGEPKCDGDELDVVDLNSLTLSHYGAIQTGCLGVSKSVY